MKPRLYRFPAWIKFLYPKAVWEMPQSEQTIYLTFDDGPHPATTPWLLDLLDEYGARATFFCLGKNVVQHPELYELILQRGHATGNHGMLHLNGFRTPQGVYLNDALQAGEHIRTNLFRPPYGRITYGQFRALKKQGYRIVFWSHMSYDFDASLQSEKRITRTREQGKPGGILVFHDNEKAQVRLRKELPQLLKYWSSKGFTFDRIELK